MNYNIKLILQYLVIYIIYINIFNGYNSYLPTIPIYPNNDIDLRILKTKMTKRTQEDIEFFFRTNDSVSTAFLPYVNEKEEDLIKVLTSQNYIINVFKYSINRRRPYQIDKNLNPLSTKTSRTPAYPSGHAYQALLLAKYLTDKYPEKRELFNKIALRCDDCRVTAGIHYKSDGEFSRKLFKFFNL
jgi:hypothetical protein